MKKLSKSELGFGTVEIILVIIILALIGVVGWFVYKNQNKTTTSSNTTTGPVNTPTTVDPYADWTAYSSSDGQYSLKYPKTWVKATSPDLCGKTIFLVGANSTSVGKCGSDDPGQMVFDSVSTSELTVSDLEMKLSDFSDLVTEKVTVNGVSGEKQTGTFSAQSVTVGLETGQKMVIYLFTANGYTYSATYKFNANYPDVLNDFNTVVTKTWKFSS